MISFTIHSRFRESFLLAMGLISWKWTYDEYDQFCYLLFTTTMSYSIPFGILLFFDAIDDLYRLSSKEVIFIALNNLFHHPSNVLRKLYFISSLFKLPEDILEEWMNLHFKDEKSLSTIVYQRLWSL
jgi:hypothetical protein